MGLFSASNKTVVDAKRAERTRRLDANRKEFTADHDAYLCATATQIVDNVAQGKWTASGVLEAYIQRAIVAHDQTNCLTEIMFDDAREAAKELDAEFAEKGAIRGPLHGVPFSIKDQFKVKGYDTTMGFSRWTNDPANEDAVMVSQIIAAGGIPFVKTNVPQATLTFECNNPLWGRSLNPYNKGYTCGGSSGGEAALLALDGSALGVGTDIGGSLRIPPAYCGIYGFKPCFGRLSKEGVRGPSPGFEGLRTTTGPMARSVKDLELFCRALFGSTETDPVLDVAPVPFRDIQLPGKLKFGYYTTDGFIKASPANKRAVLETVEALRKQGHECVEFMPPNVHESLAIFVSINSADAYKQMLSHFGPDPLDDGLKMLVYAAKLPGFVTSFAAWILTTVFGDRKAAGLLPAAGAKSYGEYSKCIENRNAYERTFYQEVWHKYKFDGIICPVQAVPQLPNGGATEYSFLAAGTILYNILDSPSGVIPVSWVDPEKDKLTEEWTSPKNSVGSPFIEGQIYRGKKPFYDPEGMKDMPIAIQVVGKRWDEEKVLGMMDVVDKALGERGFGPGACTSRTKAVNGG